MTAPDASPLAPDDWVFLNSYDRVCVLRENENLTYGTVDLVAPDASVFWVWLDQGMGRVAIHENDNVTVWFEVPRPWLPLAQLPVFSELKPTTTEPDPADSRPKGLEAG